MLDTKKAIKHLMLDRGIKAGEMANLLGIKQQAFSNWLYRPDVPKVNKADEILNHLGCHLAIVDNESGEILY